MAKEDNLHPSEYKLTQDEQKAGGKASGEARRRKRDLRLMCQMVLEMDVKTKDGLKSGAEAITLAQLQKALKGDAKAYEVLRDTAGQKPVEKVEQVNIDMEYEQSMKYVNDLMRRRNEESS